MVVPNPHPTIYFGYGSNLWIDQMNRRCPENKLIGIGYLNDWKWIINWRGYANIIKSSGDIVYGLVYELSESDEASLDISEGVPSAYVKEILPVDLIPRKEQSNALEPADGGPRAIDALVYVDFKRVQEGEPKEEYIHRINKGIVDGTNEGVPYDYFEKYFRPFIPATNTDEVPHVKDPFAPDIFRAGAEVWET